MKVYTKSDIGKERSENQDRVWSGFLSEDTVAVILCDGMGGENAGGLASSMTVDFISDRIKKGFRPDINRNSLRNLLITSVNGANSLVYGKANSDSSMKRMGTTCVSVIANHDRAYIINVGDSRAYHIFGDNIQQVTKDHTYVRKLIDDGQLSEAASRLHPERNCITRAVGAEETITPDYFELDLHDDSILLLCSDGLHAYGNDVNIAEIVVNSPINKSCDLLVDYALKNGGRDNITVAVIAV